MNFEGKVTKIFGPPGTGKTTWVLEKIEKLLEEGVSPYKISLVSFTKKAVKESIERAVKKFPRLKRDDFEWFRTIHSLCYNFHSNNQLISQKQLYDFAKSLGLDVSKHYSAEDGVGNKTGDRIIYLEALARSRMVTSEQQFLDSKAWDFSFLAVQNWEKKYRDFKNKEKLIDFVDLLKDFNQELDVDYFFIDEAQDLSPLQWEVVKKASKKAKEIFIAGDDDQSIYKWAGSSEKEFLEQKGEEIVLQKSYRLPRVVFELSKKILEKIENRKFKDFLPTSKEGKLIYINNISSFKFKKDEEYLILFRNRWKASEVSKILKNKGIPFCNSKEFSINKEILKAIEGWENWVKVKKGMPKELFLIFKKLSTKIEKVEDLCKEDLLKQPWYKIFNRVKPSELNYIKDCIDNGYNIQKEPKVKISTIHQAKGGESNNVILFLDVSQKVWDHLNDEDEHRVWYVAITRSKQNLFIVREKSNKFYRF